MTRIGIVFYSRSGTARAVAERLAAMTQWPVHEIRDPQPRLGLRADLRCIVDVLFKRSPAYRYDGPALDAYDHVVLIAPVWLRSLAAPMRAFLRNARQGIRAYSVICVMSGYGGFRAVDDMASAIGAKPRSILLLKQFDVLAGESDAALCRFKAQLRAFGGAGDWDAPVLPAVD
ncbi:flavodoxin family protein [Achromobacter dolens]|uniref:flavodoxin family protein n=1 Tax=Achromobacter dolens TaxID=1287738 RepID=UPI000A5D5E6E|nr:flavodoxin family protein [Achromobacter dolens]